MRFTRAFIPTTKETPNDAVLPSHIYLTRGGFIAQVASGLYNFMPLGLRVLHNIENIVREEMANAGVHEVNLAFVTPASLWEESGRLEKFGKELLRFRDRKENLFVLGPTHEEMMVSLVRNRVSSYKQLPLNLYQMTSKFRDEARPRFGLMRGREFLMKDGYSFHATHEDMVREFHLMEATYKKILTRLGLEFRVVEADSGAIGGSGSKEIMVLANSGEDTLAVCSSCEYGANVEAAKRQRLKAPASTGIAKAEKVHTPDTTSIEALSHMLKVDSYYTIKAVAKLAIFNEGSQVVLFFVRGCDELQEVKAANAVGANSLEDVDAAQLEALGLSVGFIGPKDFGKLTVVYDVELQSASSMVCGANEKAYHLTGFDMATVSNAIFKDIATVREGDACPHCGASMHYTKGIECGHIFQLGDTYSKPLQAHFLDENGKAKPFIMGTYGLGISRLVAAIVEQHHDEKGCKWSSATAPYRINIMISNTKDEAQNSAGEALYAALLAKGESVILDDRNERFGFKIKDAELIGFPYTIIFGNALTEGNVEVLHRQSDTKHIVPVSTIESYLSEQL
ncbi:MAG: prolyl-tRNA synthetase [Sulfurovum sp. PC08-66]|nr:MAG: prolyl-tRNA synthetase [Sulfurovum sp. PC08-66]KIM12374.1 MAG: prolyl-tRNA synthetase [Sulfuricurvum sp. PC08-66]